MQPMTAAMVRVPWRGALEALAALAGASLLAWLLEAGFDLRNASAVYLLAVAAMAIRWGTGLAIVTALGATLTYNYFFVEPRFTLLVGGAEELVMLLLLLFVGVVIGRLAGLQRDRERRAAQSEREARALFAVTRELATATNVLDALPAVVERVVGETAMSRIWVGLGATQPQERIAADSGARRSMPAVGTHSVLRRDQDEATPSWTRIHPATPAPRGDAAPAKGRIYRVEIRGGDSVLGSLWAERAMSAGDPQREESRLLAATADQLGQALHRERLVAQAADFEVARRSDDLKSALLDSVSHDLRTPLATIRATAGSLADDEIQLTDAERRAAAAAIDREAERLNRLVGDLLDMSRIQAGALVPQLEVLPLDEIVGPAVDRLWPRRARGRPTVDIPPDLPSVRADPVLLDQVVANLLENASKHAGEGAPIRITADSDRSTMRLTVEDGGPGVPADAVPSLFDRFHRVSRTDGARRGFGLGLAVVRGLVEAMGGTASAGRSELGGLAVTITLPIEPAPAR
jgi:two-component system, OmpR family, sensor histidine kinase KdpD